MIAMFGGVTYLACLLAVARSIPVVERGPTLRSFGGGVQSEYVELRRAPAPSEVFFRMAHFTAAMVPVAILFVAIFRPKPEYPLISTRRQQPLPDAGGMSNRTSLERRTS